MGDIPVRAGEAYVNSSSKHVFDVLEYVIRSPVPVGVADVAREIGLPMSTAHRALITLEETEYLHRRDGGTKFEVGLAALELRNALLDRYQLSAAARPILDRLAATTGETVALNVRLGWYSLRVAGIEGRSAVHVSLRLGAAWPLHFTTTGIAMLAFCESGEIDRYFKWWQSRSDTSTKTSADDERTVRRQVKATASRGYARETGLVYRNGHSIAFPVRDTAGTPLASLIVAGSALQFEPEADRQVLEQWADLATELEQIVAADPDRFRGPFDATDPDRIALTMPFDDP
jgi:DNA-binding IclR family transcriptional regulator